MCRRAIRGINPVVKDTLIELILHENRQHGAAFLIVSHQMEIIRRICPRVTVMIAGPRRRRGPLDEIARREDASRLSRKIVPVSALLTARCSRGYLPASISCAACPLEARSTKSRW